jgi:hypothetical protein
MSLTLSRYLLLPCHKAHDCPCNEALEVILRPECSINNKYYTGATIYIRAVNIEWDGEQYGTYYQAVRSYREQGKVKQEVIHLGEHQTAEEALTAWEREIGELQTARPKQARKLQAKLERLRILTYTD